MKTKIFILVSSFLFIFPTIVLAQNIPNLPTLQKYVNDFAGVLSSSDVSRINGLAAEIEANSTVQVAVLTINSTQPYDMDSYANQVFRSNGIGQKQNNNGILIVVAVTDRRYRIEIGYGLEGLIPDAKVGDIGRFCFVDNFRNNQYGDGIYCAVQDIGNIVQGQPEVIASTSVDSNTIIIYILAFFGVFLLPIFAALIYFAKDEFYQKCPKDGTRMHMHVTRQGIIYECPKCHFKKKKPRRRYVWFWFGGMGGGWSSGGGGGGGGFGGGSSGGGGGGGGW